MFLSNNERPEFIHFANAVLIVSLRTEYTKPDMPDYVEDMQGFVGEYFSVYCDLINAFYDGMPLQVEAIVRLKYFHWAIRSMSGVHLEKFAESFGSLNALFRARTPMFEPTNSEGLSL